MDIGLVVLVIAGGIAHLFALYWIVRLAVAHGGADALARINLGTLAAALRGGPVEARPSSSD